MLQAKDNMRSLTLLGGAVALLATFVVARPAAENTCIVAANGFEAIDDSPAINDALTKCGNGGTIVLPADQYYSIYTPIDFSNCHNCDFQIEGKLIMATSALLSFAKYDRSVFTIANATGVRIRSITGSGVIDGNAYSWYRRTNWSPKQGGYPFVHITDTSSNISVSNLHFKDIQDRVFLLQGNSSDLHFSDLRITADGINGIYASFDNFAFEMGEVSDVSVSNLDIEFNQKNNMGDTRPVGTCFAFDHGTSSVSITNVSCRRAWMGAQVVFGTIIPSVVPTSATSAALIQNITVTNFTFAGSHATGVNSWWNGSKKVIRGVTWEWVTVEEGSPADFDPCYATARSTSYWPSCMKAAAYEVRDLAFRHFRGRVGSPPTDPNWGEVNGFMDVETEFVDWVADA